MFSKDNPVSQYSISKPLRKGMKYSKKVKTNVAYKNPLIVVCVKRIMEII